MFGNGAAIGIVLIIIPYSQQQEWLEIHRVRKLHLIQQSQQKKNAYIAAGRLFVLINTAHATWLEPEVKVKLAAAAIMLDSAA